MVMGSSSAAIMFPFSPHAVLQVWLLSLPVPRG